MTAISWMGYLLTGFAALAVGFIIGALKGRNALREENRALTCEAVDCKSRANDSDKARDNTSKELEKSEAARKQVAGELSQSREDYGKAQVIIKKLKNDLKTASEKSVTQDQLDRQVKLSDGYKAEIKALKSTDTAKLAKDLDRLKAFERHATKSETARIKKRIAKEKRLAKSS